MAHNEDDDITELIELAARRVSGVEAPAHGSEFILRKESADPDEAAMLAVAEAVIKDDRSRLDQRTKLEKALDGDGPMPTDALRVPERPTAPVSQRARVFKSLLKSELANIRGEA